MATLWRFPLQPQQSGAGTAVTAAALTSGLIGTDMPILPGGIYQPGARLVLRCHGEVTSTSSTPTVIVGFYFNPVGTAIAAGNTIAISAALPISASATAWPFTMLYNGTFRTLATGVTANGVLHGSGEVFSWINTGLSGDGTINPIPVTAALRTVSNFNTQIANQIDVGITLSATTGTPSVTITDMWAELTG